MLIGQLNKIIEIHTAAETTQASGQRVKTFTLAGRYFANVQEINVTEGNEANQKVGEKSTVFTMRKLVNVVSTALVKYNSLFYEITGTRLIDNDVFIEISCVLRDNQNVNG